MQSIQSFSDFKLSNELENALNEMGFIKPTKVQQKAIPFCLKGKSVIVQAKTGSGKTLAFLIPIIENLHRMKCNSSFGIQAIILVPTAELASQIINILSNLIKYHPNITYISVVGGKSHMGKKAEWKNINTANILISTVGRLLEHQEKNINLDISELKFLIIDETDYLLKKNFSEEVDAVLNYFPKNLITWLFSATQISTLYELKRLSINNPIHIGTESSEIMIPKNLTQTFMKIELFDKLQALWNLLEAQNNSNVIVFFSTQKQVLFIYHLFSFLRPNYKILQLRSNMRLDKRVDSVQSFLKCKKGCVLLATDIASRGLDFPNVSLIIQYDLPREFDDYIHRAGRTARFNNKGVSLLMVMPSELGFMKLLKEKNINLKQIRGNVLKNQKKSISEKACIKYSSDLELFKIAKNAFLAYLRDYAKMPPKFHSLQNSEEIFLLHKLPIKKFAMSMGFRTIPEEVSQVGPHPSLIVPISESQKPFFLVKKRINTESRKRKLEISSESEECDSTDETSVIKNETELNIKPSFDFDEVFAELQSFSARDKSYYKTKLKPKYARKTNKHE